MRRLAILAAFLAAAGCAPVVHGSGNVVTKSLQAPGSFHAVRGGGAITLTVKRGDAAAISVETDDNLVDLLRVEAKDGTLVLETTESWESKKGFRVTVTTPALDGVDVGGAVHATVDLLASKDGAVSVEAQGASTLTVAEAAAKTVRVIAEGASTVKLAKATPETLEAEGSGASTITVAGACGKAKLSASGASHVGNAELRAKTADVDASGASVIDLDVAETLKADASGASAVLYGGNPKVDPSTSGASKVTRR